MKIQKEYWGEVNDRVIYHYTLKNSRGMEVKVTNYGGRITSLKVPAEKGEMIDVVLGFDNLEDYLDDNPYFGSIVGRYCNRIAGGRFRLDKREYRLAGNEDGNHLHGGSRGFDRRIWRGKVFKERNMSRLSLSYLSPDGEEGYPGNLKVNVTYTLTADCELKIDYRAESDKTTVINLTNHSYFNLSGGKDDILNHTLQVNADYYTPVDKESIPTGEIQPVAGTPLDFRQPARIGSRINNNFRQLQMAGGYDHNYVLREEANPAAVLSDPETGIIMKVYTDQPGMQIYTGNFLDGNITGKRGEVYNRYDAVCLETQHFPDSPNRH